MAELVGKVDLERTWRSRLKRERPELVLDRFYAEANGLPSVSSGEVASEPLPMTYQTGFPPEFAAHLPRVIGRYPLGAQLVRMARALELDELDELDPLETEITVSLKPPAMAEVDPVVQTITNRTRHTSFRKLVEDGSDTPLLPFDPWCTYALFVNDGAVGAFLAFDKAADTDGIPLDANGGFYELTLGTVSEVRATGDGGQADIRINVGYAYPYPRG